MDGEEEGTMEYRNVGNSGLKVSPLCVGTTLFGGRTDETEAERIVESMREHGVNFLDTADTYMDGEAERLVGRLIRRDREDWVVATKAGFRRAPGAREGRLSRKWLFQAIDRSLARLDADYVDILYLHVNDPETPLAETVAALGDIIWEGKARYWGFSNHFAWQIAEMVRLSDAQGVPRPVIGQPHYNILKRSPEREFLPACAHFGIGVAPYAPLARGVLTGKYIPGREPPPDSRRVLEESFTMTAEFHPECLEVARKIKQRAEERGMTAAQFAVLWVLNNRIVTSAIGGARTCAQWLGYLGALEHTFTADDEAFVEGLVATGRQLPADHVSHHLPVTGRRPVIG